MKLKYFLNDSNTFPAFRRELTVRAQSAKDDMWRRIEQTQLELVSKEEEQKAVSSGEISTLYRENLENCARTSH